jgi:hypothetical protein
LARCTAVSIAAELITSGNCYRADLDAILGLEIYQGSAVPAILGRRLASIGARGRWPDGGRPPDACLKLQIVAIADETPHLRIDNRYVYELGRAVYAGNAPVSAALTANSFLGICGRRGRVAPYSVLCFLLLSPWRRLVRPHPRQT